MSNQVLTVSQLNYSVRHLLEVELGSVWLSGEISNFSQPISGHWYLTLKDERAQVRCAMFRMKNQQVKFQLQNGMQVLVRANVSLYEPRGDYQLILESMQPAGDGLLQQQFEQLKMKLAAEGLFAQQRKRPIPPFVKRVGIITSKSGAALQDILNILRRRDPSLAVVIYPTQVQGKEATNDIVSAIEIANVRGECDVLIVGRGGGSLEDLWCFNEEAVARAIFHSRLPIISAVGHETDVTIADFVADLRAPTPSAAAEIVSRDQQELLRLLHHHGERASLAFDRLWAEKLSLFKHLSARLNAQHPIKQVRHQQQQLVQFQQRIQRATSGLILFKNQQLQQFQQRLQLQHPLRQLQRQRQQFTQKFDRLQQQIQRYLCTKQGELQQLHVRLVRNPLPHQIRQQQQQQRQFAQRLQYAIEKKYQLEQQKFQQLCTQLEGLSPLKILARGYSITQLPNGHVVENAQQVTVGDRIHSVINKGVLVSEIVEVQISRSNFN